MGSCINLNPQIHNLIKADETFKLTLSEEIAKSKIIKLNENKKLKSRNQEMKIIKKIKVTFKF